MELLCRILHFQREHVPEVPPLPTLKALALVCDKWNCNAAVSFSSRAWLEAVRAMQKEGEVQELLAVAYLFDDAKVFEEITRHLILNRVKGFAEAAVECPDEVLPIEVFRELLFSSPGWLLRGRIRRARYPSTVKMR